MIIRYKQIGLLKKEARFVYMETSFNRSCLSLLFYTLLISVLFADNTMLFTVDEVNQ